MIQKLTVTAPDQFEDDLIDLFMDKTRLEVTLQRLEAIASDQEALSLREQVTGKRSLICITLVAERLVIDEVLQELRQMWRGLGFRYTVEPLLEVGEI
jgi:hypothetical protein